MTWTAGTTYYILLDDENTGCGKHPWLDPIVDRSATCGAATIGYVDDQSDPEQYPDQVGGLDGMIDVYSGHGTFICGGVGIISVGFDIPPNGGSPSLETKYFPQTSADQANRHLCM